MQPVSCGSGACLIAALFSTGAFAASRPASFEDCEEEVRRNPATAGSYRCFAAVARRTNQWDRVVRRLDAILAFDPENQIARWFLARFEADQGRDRAEQLYRTAIKAMAATGKQKDEAEARLDFSFFFAIRGRLDEADAEISRAEELAEGSGDPVLLANVRIQRAWQAYRRADYGRAELLLKRVEPDIFPDGPTYSRSIWLSAVGAVCWAMGRFQEAQQHYVNQAELLHQAGDLFEEASARSNISLVTARLLEAANEHPGTILLELDEKALAVARAGGNRRVEAKAHLFLGQNPLKPTQEKRDHLRRGLALSKEQGSFQDYLLGLRLLGGNLVSHEPRAPEEGFRLIDEAIEQARDYGNLEGIVSGRTVRAFQEWEFARHSRWKPGLKDRAISSSLAALDAVEAIRDRQGDAVVRARTFSRWALVYERFAGNLLWPPDESPGREDLDLAFRVLERKRARVLLDELDASRVTAALSPNAPAAQERARVLKEMAGLQRRLKKPDLPEEERANLILDLERGEIEEAALRTEIAAADPRYAATRAPRIPSLAELEQALSENEALLSYQVTIQQDTAGYLVGGSWLLAHTQRGTRVYRPPERDVIDESVELYVGLLLNRDGSEEAGAARLYTDLFGKALADLPHEVTRLIIVPDGVLHRLPFAALRPEPGAEPLGARYQISLAPSATVWLRLRQSPFTPAEAPALAMVDPDLSANHNGEKPDPPGEAAAERAAVLASAARLGPLPHARREARTLARHLGRGCRILAGREASERSLKESGPGRFGILHFAAHALVDDQNPGRSAVLLAPGAADEDGLLQIREVVELDLSGRTVVLSACRSASGTLLAGEGVLSLARAFFVAGARAVVGNLWPVRDDEAAPLFEAFYRSLGKGKNLGEALLATRRDRARAGAPPAAWAGLVVLGDDTLVPLPGGAKGIPIIWWYVAAAAALAAATGIALRLRIRRRRASAE
jgi:CHAT domain-containing protein